MYLHKIGNTYIALILAMLLVFITSSRQAMCQNKKALLIGISSYPTSTAPTWSTIHGANDVKLLYTTLSSKGYTITRLCDSKATSTNIKKALSSLVSNSKAGDTIYIHFSCHGQPVEDINGDEEDGWDESIVPYDAQMSYIKGVYEGEHHITDDELNTYLSNIRKTIGARGFLCVVIDACHAGGSSRGDTDDEGFCRGTQNGFSSTGRTYRPRINAQGHFQITRDKWMSHIVILEACRSYQSNYEISQGGTYYGPLSYYVNQVLSKEDNLSDVKWINQVKKMMEDDVRLTRQNMVYESSIQ